MIFESLGDILTGGLAAEERLHELFRCAAGTMIRVVRERGDEDRPIESLVVGDRVAMASGEPARVLSVGHATISARHRREPRLWPIRIHRDALGPDRPDRDLQVSPQQLVTMRAVASVAIPALWLVNGSTLEFARDGAFTYWHLELDRHGPLLANNVPVQSYASALRSMDRDPDLDDGYQFLRDDRDPALLEAIRDVVASRAATLGWTPSCENDFYLLADGRELPHEIAGHEAFAAIPAGTRELRICAPFFRPSWFGVDDTRKLGLAVLGMKLVDSAGQGFDIDLDATALRPFFHEGERLDACGHRWTNGDDLVVPLVAMTGHDGAMLLRLGFYMGTNRWRKNNIDESCRQVTDA